MNTFKIGQRVSVMLYGAEVFGTVQAIDNGRLTIKGDIQHPLFTIPFDKVMPDDTFTRDYDKEAELSEYMGRFTLEA